MLVMINKQTNNLKTARIKYPDKVFVASINLIRNKLDSFLEFTCSLANFFAVTMTKLDIFFSQGNLRHHNPGNLKEKTYL